MINRSHRFHGHASLQYVHKHGQTARAGSFSLRFVRNDRRRAYRAAVIVSKKVHKSAVVRNRIRRRLYELVRVMYGAPGAYDMAFMVYDDKLATIPADQLRIQLQALLKKAGLAGGQGIAGKRVAGSSPPTPAGRAIVDTTKESRS